MAPLRQSKAMAGAPNASRFVFLFLLLLFAAATLPALASAASGALVDYGGDVCNSNTIYMRYSTTVLAAEPSADAATILFQTASAVSQFDLRCLHVYETPPMDANGVVVNNPFWVSCAASAGPLTYQVCSSEADVFSAVRDAESGKPTTYTFVPPDGATCVAVSDSYRDKPLTTMDFGYPDAPRLYWRIQLVGQAPSGPHCYPLWVHMVAMVNEYSGVNDKGAPMVWIIVVCVAIFVLIVLGGFLALLFCSDSFRRLLRLRPRGEPYMKDLPAHHHALSPPRLPHQTGHGPHKGERSGSVDSAVYAGQALEDIPPLYSEGVHRGLSVASSAFSPTRHVPRATLASPYQTAPSASKRIDYASPDTDRSAYAINVGNGGGEGWSSVARRRGASANPPASTSVTADYSPAGATAAYGYTDDHHAGGDVGEASPLVSGVGRRLDSDNGFERAAPAFFSEAIGASIGGLYYGERAAPINTNAASPPSTHRPQPRLPSGASQSPLGDLGGNSRTPIPLSATTNSAGGGSGMGTEGGSPPKRSLYESAIASEARQRRQVHSPNDGSGSPPPPVSARSPWLDFVAAAEEGAGGTIMLPMGDDDDGDDDADVPVAFGSTVGLRPPSAAAAAAAAAAGGRGGASARLMRGGGDRGGTFGGELRRRAGGPTSAAAAVEANFLASEGSPLPASAVRSRSAGVGTNVSPTASPSFDERPIAASPERLAASRYVPAGHAPAPNFGAFGDYSAAPREGLGGGGGLSRQFAPPPPMAFGSDADASGVGGHRRHISFAEDNPPPVASPPFQSRYALGGGEGAAAAGAYATSGGLPPLPSAYSYSPNERSAGSISPPSSSQGPPHSRPPAHSFGRYTVQQPNNNGNGNGGGASPQFSYTDEYSASPSQGSPARHFSAPLQRLDYGGDTSPPMARNGGGGRYFDPMSMGSGSASPPFGQRDGSVTGADFDRL